MTHFLDLDLWDQRFIDLAAEAQSWTKGPDAGVGVCLVSPDKRGLSLGFSGFPRGLADTDRRLTTQSVKDAYLVHAELNAILNAGRSVAGWTLYSTKFPCSHCAAAIIQAGIVEVVSLEIDGGSRWASSQDTAKNIMTEAQLKIRTYNGYDKH